MLKINKVVIFGILLFTQLSLSAQNNTNSPYTRFGYGELADRSFGAGRAMGGIGYGLRSPKQINPLNPASYTSMDSLTFLFDFGASAQLSWFDDGKNTQHNVNGNVEYIALQFPITRRLAMSVGLLPYSYVGYDYGDQTRMPDGKVYQSRYIGTGGLNEVYGGLSIDIWKKRLSAGVNAGFLFGNIVHEQNLSFLNSSGYSTYRKQRIEVRDMKLDFGLQYTHPLSATDRVTLGAVFSPGKRLKAKTYETMATDGSEPRIDTLNQAMDIPDSYGAGLSYVKDNKLTVAADFLFENWGNARFFDRKGDFKDRIRIAGGVEFIPDYMKKSFFSRVRYRAGVHYSNSYLRIDKSAENNYNGYGYSEYGASIGLGLPLVDNRSLVNVSFEYVKIRPENRPLIDEQYFRFTVNYTFNERWFMKFKVD